MKHTSTVSTKEELPLGGHNSLKKSPTVLGGLGRGLAVVVHIGGPVIHQQAQVMSSLSSSVSTSPFPNPSQFHSQ